LFEHWKATTEVSVFPFRAETFVTTPSKAKLLLGWSPKHSLEKEIAAEIAAYEAKGGFAAKWTLEELRCDMEVAEKQGLTLDVSV